MLTFYSISYHSCFDLKIQVLTGSYSDLDKWREVSTTGLDPMRPHLSALNGQPDGKPFELFVRVSAKRLGKTEEKLRAWGKLSTTNEPRARK